MTRGPAGGLTHEHIGVRFVEARRDQISNASIQRHQPRPAFQRKAQQVRIGNLPVPGEPIERDPLPVGNRKVVGPEDVVRQGHDASQKIDRLARRLGIRPKLNEIRRVAKADEHPDWSVYQSSLVIVPPP